MAISLTDLSPKAREQIAAKLAIDEAKKINASKQNKYKAEKVETYLEDGTPYTFASRKECRRYEYLLTLKRLGEISDLELQKKYLLIPKQEMSDGSKLKPVSYVADFVYKDKNGTTIVEDVKGYKDPQSAAYKVFRIKVKLMKFVHGIEVKEV